MPLPIQNFGHILTDLVDAVLVGDELALDVLTLQRAAQQGGIRQIELTGCRIAAGTPVASIFCNPFADSYAALLPSLRQHRTIPPIRLEAPLRRLAARHLRCQNAR